MNYGKINYFDIVNGTGIRVSLFVSGCPFNCKGCFNQIARDYNYGENFTDDTLNDIFDYIDSNYTDGLSILGGEPLAPDNMEEVLNIVKKFKERYPEKTIWIFSGYKYEDIIRRRDDSTTILEYIDVLVDGLFIEEKRDLSIPFRGSSNQRLIDIKKSSIDNIVEYDIEG